MILQSPRSNRANARSSLRPGFTLIELMVVIGIIVVLIAAVVTGGSALMERARVSSTRATMEVVSTAIDQFAREEPPLTKSRQRDGSNNLFTYADRFGVYPPDALGLFSDEGLTGDSATGRSLAPGGATVVPDPTSAQYPPLSYTRSEDLAPAELQLEHRDIAAMWLAIHLYSPAGREILSQIPKKHLAEGAIDSTGKPAQFLDRDGDGQWSGGGDDLAIPWIVDEWGHPLAYYAHRSFNSANPSQTDSENDPGEWSPASSAMIRINDGKPVLMSFGPDGDVQLSAEVLTSDPTVRLHRDWVDGAKVDNEYNKDNIYVDASLRDRLLEGGN